MRTLQRGSAAALAVLAMAGCSDGTAPDVAPETLNGDVATLAARATVDDLDDMWLPAEESGPVGAPEPGRRDGERSRSRTLTYLDAGGSEMEAYDPLLTASVEIVLDVSATRQGPRWEASLERHREMTISGLEGEETERTWNGVGTDDVSRMRVDEGRSYVMDGTTTISDVVVGVPRADHPWPLAGTITRHVLITVLRDGNERTVERTVTITFDGTQFATLVVDGETYEVDLADREGRRPRRMGG